MAKKTVVQKGVSGRAIRRANGRAKREARQGLPSTGCVGMGRSETKDLNQPNTADSGRYALPGG